MSKESNIYIIGSLRYTDKARPIYENNIIKAPFDFLTRLQSLMEEFGVAKVDLLTGAFKYSNRKTL